MVELSCSFEGAWVLSCSSEITGSRPHPKTLFLLLLFVFLFGPCHYGCRCDFFSCFFFPVIISDRHFFLGACPFHRTSPWHSDFFFVLDVSSNMFVLQTVLFPGKLWCGLQLWTSNMKTILKSAVPSHMESLWSRRLLECSQTDQIQCLFETRMRWCHQVLDLNWEWALSVTVCLHVSSRRTLRGFTRQRQFSGSFFLSCHSSLLCLPLILLFTSKVKEISSYHLVFSVETPLKRPTCMSCMFVFKLFIRIKEEPLYWKTLKWAFLKS